MGVVVRRYIDFLYYSSCICTFLQQHPYHLFNVFRSLIIIYATIVD